MDEKPPVAPRDIFVKRDAGDCVYILPEVAVVAKAECDAVAEEARLMREELLPKGMSRGGNLMHLGLIPPYIYASNIEFFSVPGNKRRWLRENPAFQTGMALQNR